jgi:hypothetical protein
MNSAAINQLADEGQRPGFERPNIADVGAETADQASGIAEFGAFFAGMIGRQAQIEIGGRWTCPADAGRSGPRPSAPCRRVAESSPAPELRSSAGKAWRAYSCSATALSWIALSCRHLQRHKSRASAARSRSQRERRLMSSQRGTHMCVLSKEIPKAIFDSSVHAREQLA